MPEMTATRATSLADPAGAVEHRLERGHERGAVVDQLVVGHEAHDHGGDRDVEQAAGRGADAPRPGRRCGGGS